MPLESFSPCRGRRDSWTCGLSIRSELQEKDAGSIDAGSAAVRRKQADTCMMPQSRFAYRPDDGAEVA